MLGLAFHTKLEEVERLDGENKEDHINRCVIHCINESRALRELVLLSPWFDALLEGMLDNHIFSMPPQVKSTMLEITREQANIVGRKMAKRLKGKKLVAAGVDQWVLAHPVLLELAEEYPFFTPMCVLIGRQNIMNSLWGTKFRVYFGATLSILDFLTDINAIIILFDKGYTNYARANVAFLFLSLFLQVMTVYVQNMA